MMEKTVARTTIDVERDGVRIRVDGIPCTRSSTGGEAMLSLELAEQLEDLFERTFATIERHSKAPAGSAADV